MSDETRYEAYQPDATRALQRAQELLRGPDPVGGPRTLAEALFTASAEAARPFGANGASRVPGGAGTILGLATTRLLRAAGIQWDPGDEERQGDDRSLLLDAYEAGLTSSGVQAWVQAAAERRTGFVPGDHHHAP